MPSDGSVEPGIDGFAVPDVFGQSRVELCDIVTRVGRNPFRHPAIFAWDGHLGQFPRMTSRPFHIQFQPLHRGACGGGELEVALFAVDFEQERCPPVHATTDLKGYDSTVTDNAVHDELVGRGLCDQFAGFLDRYAVALAYYERGKLAKFAQAVAERVDRVAASNGQQIGAVSEIGLVGTVYRGSPIRGAADHRRRQNAADIDLGDQVLGVVDRRRHL